MILHEYARAYMQLRKATSTAADKSVRPTRVIKFSLCFD